jgi:hypothetical protein
MKVTYLVHLECCHDGLNQDSTSDSTTGHANVVLSKVEDIIPESGLEMTLHLGKIEVWASSSLDKLLGIVEEVQTKVEQTTRDGLAVNSEMLLLQVPTTGTGDECWQFTVGAKLVILFANLEVDLLANGIVEVELAVDHVVPGRCTRI